MWTLDWNTRLSARLWERRKRRSDGAQSCSYLPIALGIDCNYIYHVCNKTGSIPEERRVALDLLDVRESLEQVGDVARWDPTDHMRVDRLTKSVPTYLLITYLRDMAYALKYEHDIKDTMRTLAKLIHSLRA